MARVQNVLIGDARGSVGDATFSKWKNQKILKSKAVNSYSNPTDEQRANNSKFGLINIFAKSILAFIMVGFKAMTSTMTERNAFSKMNPYSSVVTGTAPNYVINPENLVLSVGPELQGSIADFTITVNGQDSVNLEFPADPSLPQDGKLYAAAFDKTTGELVASSLGVETVTDESLSLHAAHIGNHITDYVYIMFYVNPANGKACDSVVKLA